MSLSRLARVTNFCSNLLSPCLFIVRICSSQILSFQILLYTLFPRFPWSILLPFPNYFNFHNLKYLGINVSMLDMTMLPDHMMLHSTQPRLIPNSKFPRFTTVQQNWSNTILINFPVWL